MIRFTSQATGWGQGDAAGNLGGGERGEGDHEDAVTEGRLPQPEALFNLGLIALLAPVTVPDQVRLLDGPALCVAAVTGAAFLWRGRVGRVEGAVLVGVGLGFVGLHVVA